MVANPVPPNNEFSRDVLADLVAGSTVQVVLGFKNSPTDWAFKRLPMHDGLPDQFREQALASAINLRDYLAPRDYDPEWTLGEQEFFRLANDPPIGGNFFVDLANFANMEQFEDHRRVRTPNVCVVVAQLSNGSLAYFGLRITNQAILDRSRKVLRVVYDDGAFNQLDQTVITFRSDFDWIVWNQAVAIINSKNFHQNFRDIPALVANVDMHVHTVCQHVGITNSTDFADRIKRFPAMAVKLQRIIERADMHTRPPDVLRTYGRDYSIEVDWDQDEMIFDGSVEKQWNILRLLDEANTLGPVTQKKYETSSKLPIP